VIEGACMHGYCVGLRICLRYEWYMEEVTVSTKSNKVEAATLQS